MVFNATFNNISVISWRSVLLLDEIGVHGENHWPAASHWQILSHNVVHLTMSRIWTPTLMVISTDCIGSCESNYHTITAMTTPEGNLKVLIQCTLHVVYIYIVRNDHKFTGKWFVFAAFSHCDATVFRIVSPKSVMCDA